MTAGARPTALVLRALYLGDLLTGLPALTLLRRALPEHRVVLAAPEQFQALLPLLRPAGTVDELVDSLELAPLTAAPRHADVAVDLHGNGPASRELLAATGPRRLVAYAGGPSVWRPDEHEVARWCRLVAEAFDAGGPADWPGVAGRLDVPDADVPRGLTLVHPGAKSAARRWPVSRFAAVAAAFQADGHDVVATAGPGEELLAAAAGVPVLSGLSLTELLALVAHARLLVCGDTGLAHAASAYRTPSVVLFGPVSPRVWGPPDDPRHRAVFHGDGAGDPHGDAVDPALDAVTVEEVLAAARGVDLLS